MPRRRAWCALAGALALTVVPALARGQGAFYREVANDGRIYVFNNMRRFQASEQSGETGVGITLLGYGPKGETVVFDSEEAIHLYNFKHGRPGDPRPQPTPSPPPTISWRDGATTLTFPDVASVRISNRVQSRYTHEMPDEAVQLAGTARPGDSRGSFRLRRVKFKVDGWFYRPWLQYELQTNWPALASSNPGALLEDANVNWDLTRGARRFQVKFGQYKVPFGRQEITSSGSQQFVDRSQVSNTYARGRDLGLQLWGQLANNRLEWRAGVFNGNGLTRTTNDNDAFQWNARLMWQPNGALALGTGNSGALYSEGDFESTERPIYALALNFERNDFHRTTTAVDLADTVWGLDGVFKWRRFSATGEYYLRRREPEATDPATAIVEFDSNGYFVQAGYLFDAARRWEAALRYGSFDPTDLVAGDDQKEWRLGLSYYHNRHALKVQADFGWLEDEATGAGNQELRLQAQFIF